MRISIDTVARCGRTVGGLGFLLLLAAFVLRLRVIPSGTAKIAEGEQFGGSLEEYNPGSLIFDPDLGMPDVAFYPTKLRAVQGKRGQLMGIEAEVRVPDADGEAVAMSDTDPLEVGAMRVRLWRINVAPVFTALPATGGPPSTVAPKLTIWRSDAPVDQFRIPDVAATVHVRLFPEFQYGPKGPVTKSMALRDPVLLVRVVPDRPGGPRGQTLMRPGQSHGFGPLQLELVELRRWGEVEIVGRHRSHFAYAGALLVALGALAQLLAWILRRRRR